MADEILALNQAIADLTSAEAAKKQDISDGFAVKDAKIADLEAQLAAASGATAQQLIDATTSVNAVKDDIAGIPIPPTT